MKNQKTCFLFPGQGAQYSGMGKDLWEESLKVRELFKLAREKTGLNVEKLLFEGCEEELKETDKTQIAVTLVNLAASAVLKERRITPHGCAGFSLGEYAALHEAGVIKTEDIFSIVKIRGEIMEKASRKIDSASGKAGMAAVIGLDYNEVVSVLKDINRGDLFIANHTSPIQVVLSGTADGLKRAESAFDRAGAMRFIFLSVSGPFHSPLLEGAGKEFGEVLSDYDFQDPAIPLYSNVTGKRVKSGEEARELCVLQIFSPVKWLDEEKSILEDGYERFLEVGPGNVLSGLWKSFNKERKCRPVSKLADIEKILSD